MAKKIVKKSAKKMVPVLVTTSHRGVFFGYTNNYDGETITLKDARMCIYWSADVKGCFGLAATGPSSGCRVGPKADIHVRNVTAVALCSDAAVAAWELAPWSN